MNNFPALMVLSLLVVWIISTLLMTHLHDFLFEDKVNFWKRPNVDKAAKIVVYMILTPIYIIATVTFLLMCFCAVLSIIFLSTQFFNSVFSKIFNLL